MLRVTSITVTLTACAELQQTRRYELPKTQIRLHSCSYRPKLGPKSSVFSPCGCPWLRLCHSLQNQILATRKHASPSPWGIKSKSMSTWFEHEAPTARL